MSTIKLFEDNKKTVEAFAMLKDFTPKYELLAEVVRAELSNLRQSNAHTKVKSEVSGGGKKPWRQKGTGRARHGSTRSPIWKGGGVTHGPRNTVNWHLKINKSARTCAIKSLLSDRIGEDAIYQLTEGYDKTKKSVDAINTFTKATESKTKNIAIVYTTEDKPNVQGFTNTEVTMINAKYLQLHKLAAKPFLVFTDNAVKVLEERLNNK
ncbi:MAG: 50S ribosomal protein L4 [Patescibacteria group bacterium]